MLNFLLAQWYAFSASHHNAQLKYRYSVLVFLQLIGVILNILLYGMQLLQVEIYFRSNPRFVFPFHTLFHHNLYMILTRIIERLCYSNCKRCSRTQRLELDQGASGILAPVGYCQFRLRRVVRV